MEPERRQEAGCLRYMLAVLGAPVGLVALAAAVWTVWLLLSR